MMRDIIVNNGGKYIWGYELDLFRNPVVLKLILKIICLCFLGVYLLSCILSLGNRGFFFSGILENTKVFTALTAFVLVLTLIAYFIYAKLMHGVYCVVFEMDENGIKHTQFDKQADKAGMLSMIEMLAGISANDPGLTGIGMMQYGHTSIYTDFRKVKMIKADRSSNTIILKYGLHNNQIYVGDEDYDEVLAYIRNNCPLCR